MDQIWRSPGQDDSIIFALHIFVASQFFVLQFYCVADFVRCSYFCVAIFPALQIFCDAVFFLMRSSFFALHFFDIAFFTLRFFFELQIFWHCSFYMLHFFAGSFFCVAHWHNHTHSHPGIPQGAQARYGASPVRTGKRPRSAQARFAISPVSTPVSPNRAWMWSRFEALETDASRSVQSVRGMQPRWPKSFWAFEPSAKTPLNLKPKSLWTWRSNSSISNSNTSMSSHICSCGPKQSGSRGHKNLAPQVDQYIIMLCYHDIMMLQYYDVMML